MSKAIDDLKHEHEAILFSLKILGKMADQAKATKTFEIAERYTSFDTAEPLAFLGFLKEFADKCHHGKEEGILFPAMQAAGIANQGGPIGVMLGEHELGRGLIRDMGVALEAPADPQAFATAAEAYIALLVQHIEKENQVLFPMGERLLSPAILDEVNTRFEEHEEKVIGAGRHEELHAMLDRFEKKYLQ